ncbi:alkaline phosphatase family protein [Sphingomonas sp.]|uniref:alkaline phosphatase family protein n=1 Tax=Sphingomonas sp. TaxID=28214 RepID=UPI003AFFEBEE
MSSVPKTLVIGLGGIAWSDLIARVGKGQAPAIAAVLRRGAGLRLIDDVPGNRAAAWATLSTGVLAHQHGIVGLDEAWAGGLRPTGRTAWRHAPVWQRLSDARARTLSVAWPFTRAGAAWAGVHVDDRLAQATGRSWQDWVLPADVAPPSWREAVGEVRVHPSDVDAAALAPLVPGLETVDQRSDRRLIDLAIMIARVSTNHAAAQALLIEAPWDTAFVFHSWMAAVLGRFADAPPPYDGVVDAAWTLIDTMVAITLSAVPRDTVVVLASLGFRGEAGFLAIAGPGVKPGVRSDVAHAVDLVPSLLARYGLGDPVLGGRVLLGDPAGVRPAAPARDLGEEPPIDRAALARVEGFGHRAPAPPTGWQAHRLVRLAALTMPHDAAAGADFAAAAIAVGGEEPVAIGMMAAAAAAAGRADDLPPLAERIAAAAPGHVWEALIRGGYHALRGEAASARPYLLRVEAEGAAAERIRAGAAWLMLERPADAARAFALVTAAEPDRVDALIGLGMAHAALKPAEAEPALRRALAIDPASAAARDLLVDVLRRLGRTREADQVTAGGALYRRSAGSEA